MARRVYRKPESWSITEAGKLAVSLEAIARGRIVDAERDPDHARKLLGELSAAIAAGRDIEAPYRQWIAERLAAIAAGADANRALSVRRARGDRAKSLADIRKRLQRIAIHIVVSGISQTEAADRAAEDYHRDESVFRKLPAQYPDDWENQLAMVKSAYRELTRPVDEYLDALDITLGKR